MLGALGVKHTKKFVHDSLLSHPDYPSLLSISDTFKKYQIDNAAVRVEKDKLSELPIPFMAQVEVDNAPQFYAITKLNKNAVGYFDEEDKFTTIKKDKFLEIWTGVCFVAEKNENSKEPNIAKKVAEKRFNITLIVAITLLTLFWISTTFLFATGQKNFGVVPYLLIKFAGIIISTMLLWFEVDEFNPTLQSFCSGGRRTNCGAVLNSSYAKLLNGKVSLSLIGFSYFFASFFYLLITSFSEASLSLLAYLSFLTAPVIAISVYSQAAIIKQWCKLCIGIQLVLVGEIAVAYAFKLYGSPPPLVTAPLLLTLALLPILIWSYLKPLIQKDKQLSLYRRTLAKIKNETQVFKGLLSKSRKITTSTEGLGISLTNKDAQYQVIKVCNPYCGPCARAHPVLEKLFETGKINLQILFSTDEESHPHSLPVQHFLALDDKYPEQQQLQRALDDWYLADTKDYAVFEQKHPLNGELKKQRHKLKAMAAWCKAEKIAFTPTIFINGHELPKEYRINDLINIL